MKHFESVVAAAAKSTAGIGSKATGGGDFYDMQPFPTGRYAFVATSALVLLPLMLCSTKVESILTRYSWGPRVLWVFSFLLNLVTVSQPGRFDGNAAAASTAKSGKQPAARKKDVPQYQGGIPWTPVFAPAGWAFAIWGVIYLGESLLTTYVAAFDLPGVPPALLRKGKLLALENRPEVLALWWAAGSALQALWCLAFRPQFSNHLYVPAALLGGAAVCMFGAHGVLTRWIGAEERFATKGTLPLSFSSPPLSLQGLPALCTLPLLPTIVDPLLTHPCLL